MTRVASLILAIGLVAGCNASAPPAAAPRAPARARAEAVTLAVCTATGAHAKHATIGLACSACHERGGLYQFAPVTLGGGMTTVGGAIQQTETSTTCTVACHGTSTISWDQGPLSCTGCHADVVMADAASSHVADGQDPVAGRVECQACHLMDSHGSGVVVLATADGARVLVPGSGQPELDQFCASCHDGAGKLVGDRAPPAINDYWSTAGDPHGMAGTTAALACTGCHAAHASLQARLIAPTINGTPTSTTTIAPNGVGAEGTCVTCHTTLPRHSASGCLVECHSHSGALVGHSVSGTPVPSTYGCFYCHGHGAIEHFQPPSGCKHCHGNSGWRISSKPTEAIAPIIIVGPSVAPGTTAATVTWTTNELADNWVAYAVGDAVKWTGSSLDVTSHSVQLTGLLVGTAYRMAVRSADIFDNAIVSPWVTYTAGGPSVPMLVDESNVDVAATSTAVELVWGAVTNPSALPITYVVEVDDGPAFDSLVATASVANATRTTFTLASGATFYWRVRARDTRPYESVSAVDAFTVNKL